MSTTSEEDERRRLSLLYNKQRLSTDNYNGSQIQSIESHARQKPHHRHLHHQHQHNFDSKEVDLPVNGFHHEDGKGNAITVAPAHSLHHSASQPELRGDREADSDSPDEHSGHRQRHHHPSHHHKHHHHHHNHHYGFGSDTDLVERSAMSAIEIGQDQGSPTRQKHGLVKRYLTTLHRNKSRKKMPEPIYVPVKGVNLRDVGAVTKGPMREGAVFRSSELLSKEEMQRNQVRTILDLRRMDRPCKAQKGNKASESTKTVLKYLLWGPKKIIPEKRLIPAHRAHPQPCPLCHVKAEHRYDSDINVIHADLIPSTVGLRILQSMPWKVQLKTICYAVIGRGASSVMAPAVANDKLLGYKALYKTLLEDSKRGMAMAIRPFVDADNYPILVHCIHGKDRTGLIIMLLLMLCNVDQDAIVEDYVLSESVLKESRMHQELHMDVYLTSDDVIAATKETMEDTIEYVREKYGSAADYLKECGLEKEEIEAISKNLMRESELIKAEPVSFKPKFSLTESLTSGLQTLANPFKRRSSTFESRGPKPTMKSGVLGRVSEGEELGSRKSMSLENSPRFSRPADANPAAPESGTRFRRASLATTSLAEIRAKLAKLRLEHPELGSLTEEAPIDFLSVSDDSPDKKKKRVSNGVRSLDLDVESLPKLEDKPSRFRLKKTISCPSTPHQNSGKWFRTNNSRHSDASGSCQGSGRLPSFPEIPGGNSVSHPENVVPSGKSVTILEPAAVQKPDSQGKLPSSPFA